MRACARGGEGRGQDSDLAVGGDADRRARDDVVEGARSGATPQHLLPSQVRLRSREGSRRVHAGDGTALSSVEWGCAGSRRGGSSRECPDSERSVRLAPDERLGPPHRYEATHHPSARGQSPSKPRPCQWDKGSPGGRWQAQRRRVQPVGCPRWGPGRGRVRCAGGAAAPGTTS